MTPASKKQSKKTMNYGQSQALKVLAAHRLGIGTIYVNDSTEMLMGKDVHPTTFAAVEKEAARINNILAQDVAKIAKANEIVITLLAEYGLE